MSNVHRLSDLENRRPNEYQYLSQGQMNNSLIPMMINPLNNENPRKENFFQFCKYACCPAFSFFSCVFCLILADIFFFIFSLFLSPTIKGEFLSPSIETLLMLGAKDAYNMKKGKIYLFVTPCFLHANFIHIFSNILSTLMFGMNLESAIGVIRFLLIYFVAGIGGNLFSALINDMPAVGASTSIMGIFGAHLAFIILNWFSLRVLGFIRWQMLFLMMLIILMNCLIGFGFNLTIDNYGHIGGCLIGFCFALGILKPLNYGNYEEKLRKSGILMTFVYFLVGFIVFYTSREPREIIIINI